MSAYTNSSEWCQLVSGIKYRVTSELIWEQGFVGSNSFITVPVGRTFDVSIPTGLRWLFDPHEASYLKASALHDELLRRRWSRIEAGAVFHQALQSDGVIKWRRIAMWLAVSLRKYNRSA